MQEITKSEVFPPQTQTGERMVRSRSNFDYGGARPVLYLLTYRENVWIARMGTLVPESSSSTPSRFLSTYFSCTPRDCVPRRGRGGVGAHVCMSVFVCVWLQCIWITKYILCCSSKCACKSTGRHQGRIQGGGGGGGGGLQGAVAPPFPVPTTPLIYTSTRLAVESATKRLKGSSVLPTETVRMNQIQSQLVLGTKTVLSSDHMHGESSSDLTLIGDSIS